MEDKELCTNVHRPVSVHPVITDHLPCIVIFVAGEQSCVETAIRSARRLYPGRHFVFVCEPAHCTWLSQCPDETVFVVEQPFNPFGHRAAELLRSLEAAPIEACGLVIADIGRESFRFRVFALRLRARLFLLLRGSTPNDSKQLDRLSFALLAGVTLFFRWPRKVWVNRDGSAPQGDDIAPQVQDMAPQVQNMAPQGDDMAAQQRLTEPMEVIPELAASSNSQWRCATRESGLIHLSDGWDDALNLILFVNRLLIMVKPGARILDFGCGAGRMVFRLRELGFDAYGFDIHDYVAYRSDDDRQWFRFSQSTSSNTSAFTIDADSYVIPFEDDFFDVVHSTSVLEHVLDIRPMMRECARVLRPDGVAIHYYPRKYQVVESHLYVPLASFIQHKQWLRLWIALGARNEFQSGLTVDQVAEAYKQYTMTGLCYRTHKELLYAAGEFFQGVRFPPRAVVNPGDSVWIQIRQMMKALRAPDVYRQLALSVRQFAIVCDHKRSAAPSGS
jgi:SAM-dependent methyltransferase